MTSISRRTLLAGVGAVAVLPAIPSTALAIEPAAPLWPAWSVGTAGEFNWKTFFAATRERAIELYRRSMVEEEGYDEQTAEECDLDASPMEHMEPDTEGEHYMTPKDAEAAGWGHICDRCSYEASSCSWHLVGDEAVCMDCMTLADWDVADPQHAAELREEQQIEFWEDFADALAHVFQKDRAE